ncbi:putative Sterol-4-alpha-carboxylate 3-dehydrogenase, decarboxylating [Glarea lozoyensis 74030]|uniref:Putative Sterol-4-alpha-carboxylate 3-dehydrogenase, decarboxylating n=1 Tax=Glarea lozoyensis (strain ATCC 74030 / MF5533) TaxID=1104152 RepID=H0EZH4_GLAL7|nr:putative Sterol-4-alpha-carboxylate 3-dehydrogenase, decarboxylating [Glarea lozoyensis 74030]
MPSTATKIQSALVIGGCGSLGHRTVEQLLKLEPTPQVAVFDIQTKINRIQDVNYYDVDITNKDQIYSALERSRPEVIFHTASPPAALSDLPLYMRVNVDGTRNLIECAKVGAFVYTSSASVVHDSVSDMTDGDDSLPLLYLPDQTEIYSHSKAVADQLVLNANSTTPAGMLTSCIRPSMIFGEGDYVTGELVKRAAEGKYKWQIGDGKNECDWTFNENVIHAQFLAAEALLDARVHPPASDDMKVAGQGFLITNDEHISFWKFARLIGNAAGYATKEEDVRSMPKAIGILIAAISEWIVWIMSFGKQKSRINRLHD